MLDHRFYVAHGPLSLAGLFPDCEIRGPADVMLSGAADLAEAGSGDLGFLDKRPRGPLVTRAGAVIVAAAHADALPETSAKVISAHPRAAFARALARLIAERAFQAEPAIAADVQIEPGAQLAPGVVVGPGAMIGAGASIGPNAVIGPGVASGRRTQIGANCSVRCALIGDDVTILPGAVIGEPGFAVAPGPQGAVQVPHIGRVIVQDRVRIGAGVTVDRGLFADTLLSEGAKIDNLSHIAHNVVIGRNVVMAAFAGISGSSRIGDGAMLGGRVGVADHLEIGAGARIAAGSAVLSDVPAGETWGGYPAKPLRRFLRETAWLSKAAGRGDVGQ
jgi:UDP-3-O-[3-hydroxymyristoyl] glucosamine N-acyltransferase